MTDSTWIEMINAAKFRDLLREPLSAMGISTPSIEICGELCIWMPHPWFAITPRSPGISPKVIEKATAFRNVLPEAECFWKKMEEFGEARAIAVSQENAKAYRSYFDEEVFAKFKRLRMAISECEEFLKSPEPYAHDWHEPALNAAIVFMWVVRQSETGKDAGISPGGPLVRFVTASLTALGWGQFTQAALVKHLRREQQEGRWSPKLHVMDKIPEGLCP